MFWNQTKSVETEQVKKNKICAGGTKCSFGKTILLVGEKLNICCGTKQVLLTAFIAYPRNIFEKFQAYLQVTAIYLIKHLHIIEVITIDPMSKLWCPIPETAHNILPEKCGSSGCKRHLILVVED